MHQHYGDRSLISIESLELSLACERIAYAQMTTLLPLLPRIFKSILVAMGVPRRLSLP